MQYGCYLSVMFFSCRLLALVQYRPPLFVLVGQVRVMVGHFIAVLSDGHFIAVLSDVHFVPAF